MPPKKADKNGKGDIIPPKIDHRAANKAAPKTPVDSSSKLASDKEKNREILQPASVLAQAEPQKKRQKVSNDQTSTAIVMSQAKDIGGQKELGKSKAKNGKKKKGAGRYSAIRATAPPEASGDPNNVGSFISISNEQKLGAYIGFDDVVHLRTLLMSWPVLKAYLAFNPIATNMNKKSAFRLLLDDRAVFNDPSNRKKLWSIVDTDDAHTTKTKKDRHLASILVEMKTDFEHLGEFDKKFNRGQQMTFKARFEELVAGELKPPVLPWIDFSPKLLRDRPPNSPYVKLPELGPRLGEHELELFNRCWSLLKYFRQCRQAQGIFNLRFSQEAMSNSIMINIVHVPTWLRPKEDVKHPEALKKPDSVLAADALSPLAISIKWLKKSHIPNKEELDELLLQANLSDIPHERQIIRQDPRLTFSIESFKDHIRRLYNCQKLHTNIYALRLTFDTVTSAGTEEQGINILQQSWSETKSIFEDAKNLNFMLCVAFEAADDPEASVYESFEPTPAIAAFFDTSSGDVEGNTQCLKEMADAALSKQQQEGLQAPDDDSPKESGDIQTALDLLFAKAKAL